MSQLKAKAKNPRKSQKEKQQYTHTQRDTIIYVCVYICEHRDVYVYPRMNDGVYLRVMKTFPNFRH